MSDSNNMWPFQEISAEEGLDINEIFGTGTSNGAAAPEANPFQEDRNCLSGQLRSFFIVRKKGDFKMNGTHKK